MEPVRPLRDVFADLAGTDAAQARAALEAAGHDLSDDLLRTAIDGYAATAPAEVAEHLAEADGPDDGLALLASAPAGPWDAEVALDPADQLAGGDLDAADLLDVAHTPADPTDPTDPTDPADHAFGAGDADDGPAPGDLASLDDLDAADAFDAPAPDLDADLGFDDVFGAGSSPDDLTDDLTDGAPDDGPGAQAHDVHDAG